MRAYPAAADDWRTFFTLLDERGDAPATMVAKDGADLVQPGTGPLNLLMRPGETAGFEFPPEPGTYSLDFKQQLAGWIIPLRIRARAAPQARHGRQATALDGRAIRN